MTKKHRSNPVFLCISGRRQEKPRRGREEVGGRREEVGGRK